MKRLLVTGASGFLGWNICSKAANEWQVYGVTFNNTIKIPGVQTVKTDLTDFKKLKKLFGDIKPDAVIHAAAASKPNYCQTHQKEAFTINVGASKEIAGLCAEERIPLIFTSTDMVFNGLNPPYKEEDDVCPVNIYGEQKVVAEKEITECYPEAALCRLSLMYGYAPAALSFFQQMVQSLKTGDTIKLFTDEFRTFISVRSVIQALFLILGKAGGIFHLGGNESLSRFELGSLIAKVFGFDHSLIVPCSTKDIIMAAPRAPDLSLDNGKIKQIGFNPLSITMELEKLKEVLL